MLFNFLKMGDVNNVKREGEREREKKNFDDRWRFVADRASE
jgi:hypothetical protein